MNTVIKVSLNWPQLESARLDLLFFQIYLKIIVMMMMMLIDNGGGVVVVIKFSW